MSFRNNRTSSINAKRRSEYRLFISHSWSYSDEYERMVDLLDNANYLKYKNYSIPSEKEIDADTDEELEESLREGQIKPSSVVVVLAGLYSTYSDWIGKEIRIAEEENKPILGVEPWGSDRTSNYVERHSDKMVGWNTNSVVDGIRDLAP
ncbi:TIR domain-containing protein [Haladaptatus halobius]|uniref:TIR domain-containing protein n=1 Tax=Haladaptatus halobius TaxID=2884875 RepID=UPI001D0BC6DD|nr:TIR domain-containing protein [Haladaptatus halobius]